MRWGKRMTQHLTDKIATNRNRESSTGIAKEKVKMRKRQKDITCERKQHRELMPKTLNTRHFPQLPPCKQPSFNTNLERDANPVKLTGLVFRLKTLGKPL